MDTFTLRLLTNAAYDLDRAQEQTKCGAVYDHCQTALDAIAKAIRAATTPEPTKS